MAKKKKRNTSTFLKTHPDFLKSETQKTKETPINSSDSVFLEQI